MTRCGEPELYELMYGYCPGGEYEDVGHRHLQRIDDRPDPWRGHPYRAEQRDGRRLRQKT